MPKKLTLVACLVAFATAAQAQSLYIPRGVKKAYQNQTRSLDGRPGAKYWQNRARYKIAMTALPPDRTIKGTEDITYFNNSPDTLRTVAIKFFINIHKGGAPRGFGVSPEYLTPGVEVDAFTVNGQPVQWSERPRYFTTRSVRLPAPLAPHDSVRMSFNWHYQISLAANREGMIDSTTYYLAYFYPRVAVYDDYSGWDLIDFNDNLEFYSDFNDYDVTLTVPSKYIVWGTGTLQNAAEVLQPQYLERFRSSLTSDQTIHVATSAELRAGNVMVEKPSNTWHFTASNVPDVAFGLSDHYNWDAASVVVDDATHRRTSVQAAYQDSAADFRFMTGFAQHGLAWFSRNWPGVPYPYPTMTVFRGDADMEYPMMVNDGSNADTAFSRFVANHEMAHTYFPFYMGINETRYTFMDEGWATALEHLINLETMGQRKADSAFKVFRVRGWATSTSPSADAPIITPNATGNTGYGRPALGYLALKDLLGDALFRKALHGYMDRWHGKHPIPWDFFYSFNNLTGMNLNWFWQSWFFDNSYIDFRIEKVTRTRSGYSIAIDNIGGMPAPVDVIVNYEDGSKVFHQTPAIWKSNLKRATVTVASAKQAASIELDGGIWMDADTTNNHWQK